MDPGHVQTARENAVRLKTYLAAHPGAIANYTVRCYQHEKVEVETVILAELRKAVNPADLKRIRIAYVEFEALDRVPGVLNLGTMFIQCPKGEKPLGNRAARRAVKEVLNSTESRALSHALQMKTGGVPVGE